MIRSLIAIVFVALLVMGLFGYWVGHRVAEIEAEVQPPPPLVLPAGWELVVSVEFSGPNKRPIAVATAYRGAMVIEVRSWSAAEASRDAVEQAVAIEGMVRHE